MPQLEAPDGAKDAMCRCAHGIAPPNVALMHLFLASENADEAERALGHAIWDALEARNEDAASRLSEMQRLWHAAPGAFSTVAAIHGLTLQAPRDPTRIAHYEELFDRAAAISPVAGVALYSLGDSALLDAATAEVISFMRRCGLFAPDATALEIGCGLGRFLQALAPMLRFVAGVDISGAMLRSASILLAGCANAVAIRGGGYDLSFLRDNAFDVVFAIDSFPYLVDAGAAERHVQEAARVLKPDGRLLILNYSYRGDRDADRQELCGYAGTAGLSEVPLAHEGFVHWDGSAFLFSKRSCSMSNLR
jgi:SAM-dependent methyltransferase